MKKVLLINYSTLCTLGGIQVYNRYLIDILNKNYQCAIDILIISPSEKANDKLPSNCHYIYLLQPKNLVNPKLKIAYELIRFIKLRNKFKYFLKNNSYDLIIDSTWERFHSKFSDNYLLIQHGILDAISEKIFFQNNKCTLSNLLKEFIRFFIWRSANKILTTPTIICFDPKNENIVKQNYPSINTINIPLPSDNNLNQNLNIFESNNRRSIIYAGRIQNGAKNIASLIKLNKLLNNIIYFYGKPDSKNDEKYIEEIKSTNNYKGYFSPSNRDEYYKVLREYKFMILYSRYEGFSFSLVEALSQGIPIIVKDTYVSASFLCNSKTGLLLPRNTSLEEDSKIIKEFISKLTSESYFKMAQNCLAFYKDNLSFTNFERKWKIILDKYLK